MRLLRREGVEGRPLPGYLGVHYDQRWGITLRCVPGIAYEKRPNG